jgi:chromosome segregation ATPase
MRIEDLKSWTADQLKEELFRLADEREAKQHEILDKDNKINELQAELDKMCDYNNELKSLLNMEISPFNYAVFSNRSRINSRPICVIRLW